MRRPARVKVATADGMNGLERDYSMLLEARRLAGEIHRWRFEAVRLRLGSPQRLGAQAWFTPDFWVILPSGLVEIHETKGRWEEAARVRIKVAAELYPEFTFIVVKRPKKRDGFQFESVPPSKVGAAMKSDHG